MAKVVCLMFEMETNVLQINTTVSIVFIKCVDFYGLVLLFFP